MLTVSGPTTKVENRREFQNNRKKMMSMRRRDPRMFEHYVAPIFQAVENFERVIQGPTVPKRSALEKLEARLNQTQFEFPIFDDFLARRKARKTF
jgi:stalled ribosome rescue protein Dom34